MPRITDTTGKSGVPPETADEFIADAVALLGRMIHDEDIPTNVRNRLMPVLALVDTADFLMSLAQTTASGSGPKLVWSAD